MTLTLNVAAWRFDLDEDCGPIRLDPAESKRAVAISNPLMRNRYQRTRSLVRRALAARLNIAPEAIAISTAPGGKPQLTRSTPLHFSISHSQNILVIALCDEPIGVDVEIPRNRENALALAQRFFSIPDFESLKQTSPSMTNVAFLRQWVAKEAALKAAGIGLADTLRAAECHLRDGGIHAVTWAGQCAEIAPFDFPGGATGAFAWFGPRKASVHWHDAAELGVS